MPSPSPMSGTKAGETQPKAFTLRADRSMYGGPQAVVGATVYSLRQYDYGAANDDMRLLKKSHVSVTLDPTGDYPFFTVAEADLAPVATTGERP